MFEDFFAKRRMCPPRLLSYGFTFEEGEYRYSREILNAEFLLHVTFDRHGNLGTSLTEIDTDEEYLLYKTEAEGAFVGCVREEISAILQDIAEKCFESSIYKQEQTLQLLSHAADIYGDEPEFLWDDKNSILRRKSNGKWYAALLCVPKDRLGFDSKATVEIVDLHATSEQIAKLLDRPGFYPGWHMNKKSWYTVILDGSVDNEELFLLLAESYRLADKGKNNR